MDANIDYTSTRMIDQFVVTLVKHSDSNISTMEIRNRGTLESRLSQQMPYYSGIHSVSGRWALLYTFLTWAEYADTYRLIVWDLESGMACPGHIVAATHC
jgi:hypothetical protein